MLTRQRESRSDRPVWGNSTEHRHGVGLALPRLFRALVNLLLNQANMHAVS